MLKDDIIQRVLQMNGEQLQKVAQFLDRLQGLQENPKDDPAPDLKVAESD